MATLEGLSKAVLGLDDTSHGWKAMRCPFHGDRDASASYSTVLERFKCHANQDCPSGDGYDLIQAVELCDFETATRRAKDLCGEAFTISERDSGAIGRSKLTAKRSKDRARLVRSRRRK